MPSPHPTHATRQNLQRLCVMRALLIGAQLAALLFLYWVMAAPVVKLPMLGILLTMTAATAWGWWRSRQPQPLDQGVLFGQLLVDILGLTALLYFSGGASNPFITYLLVPVAVAAATLSWRQSWIVTALTLAAYAGLFFFHVPIPALMPGHGHHGAFNLHLVGMWANFVLASVLITYFVLRMAASLRRQEARLNRAREDRLRDEQLVGVATLAAGTAHELGTPLNTMRVLVDELRQDHPPESSLGADLALLASQVDICTSTLRRLTHAAERSRDEPGQALDLREYLQQLRERWEVMRPAVNSDWEDAPQAPALQVSLPPTLEQSLINLLNNAADASPQAVQVQTDWDQQQLQVRIRDWGPGLPADIAEQLGQTFVSTKREGMGLGLFLANATINRHGGEVTLFQPAEGGTLTEVTLPLAPFHIAATGDSPP